MNWVNGPLPTLGRCECGALVHIFSFRDWISLKEFRLSGYCQTCQDEFFLATSDEDPDASYPLRRGALAAVRAVGSVVAEVCLFPFLLVAAPVPRIAWEARWLVRAGSCYPPADVYEDLAPVESALGAHQVHLAEFQSFESPGLGERLGAFEIVVGLDGASLDGFSAACPFPIGVSFVSLVDVVPWVAAFGRELRPLDTWSIRGNANGSLLHVCALMAYVMVARGNGRRPLDHLFGS